MRWAVSRAGTVTTAYVLLSELRRELVARHMVRSATPGTRGCGSKSQIPALKKWLLSWAGCSDGGNVLGGMDERMAHDEELQESLERLSKKNKVMEA